MEFFCDIKDGPKMNQSFVVYEFIYLGCNWNYVETTERTYEPSVEHSRKGKNRNVKNQLDKCDGFHHLLNLLSLGPTLHQFIYW